jgi:hypothetical protein
MELEVFIHRMLRLARMKRLLLPLALCLAGCAAAKLPTPTGRPMVSVRNVDWKRVSVAIAAYNFEKGRDIDRAEPGELVLFDAVTAPDGTEQVRSRTKYEIVGVGDSLVIHSHRYLTSDLDNDAIDEALDRATLEIQQQELLEIARSLEQNSIAQPVGER